MILRAVRPNIGIEVAYRRALLKLVDQMHDSVMYWLTARYRANEPNVTSVTMDSLPATELQQAVRKLSRQWQGKFKVLSKELATYFAQSVSKRTDANLRAILKRGGITVRFRMTPAQQDVFRATVQQNVSLIRTIPAKYLADVEGMVMRSVQTGRDLEMLTKELVSIKGVTRRRAAFIALDQNNKATSALQRARQIELGIEQGIWVHSHAGKVPRRTHLKMDGKKYNIRQGMWDENEGAYVHPGELIHCRCIVKSIIPGFAT